MEVFKFALIVMVFSPLGRSLIFRDYRFSALYCRSQIDRTLPTVISVLRFSFSNVGYLVSFGERG